MFELKRDDIKDSIICECIGLFELIFLVIPIVMACMINIGYGHPYIWIACIIYSMIIIGNLIITVAKIISSFKELKKLNELEQEEDEWLDKF